jgi:hypothetical protein
VVHGQKKPAFGEWSDEEIQGYRFLYVFHDKSVTIGKYFGRRCVKKSRGKIKVIIIIIIIIIINCKWVDTRWQWLFYMYTECDIDYY